APQILCDEFIHAGIADSIVRHGEYAYRGSPVRYSYTYPLTLAPAWSVGSMERTYELTKATNALLLSLAAVPIYFWARRLVSFGWSIVAALLVLCMPAFAFAGLVMTENVAFPTFVLALFLMALALERPTIARQVGALAAIGLAAISRYQSLVLLPVFVLAAVLKLGLDWRAGVPRDELRRRAIHLAGAVGVALALAVAYVVWKAARHQPLASGLGPYAGLESGKYPLHDVIRWTYLNAGEFVLAAGFVGACALVLLAWEGGAGRLRTDALRSFVAVAVVAVGGVLLEVGIFAAGVAHYIVERYSFYALPAVLLGLVVWLGNGMPRPRLGVAVAILVPLGFVLTIETLQRNPLHDGSLPVNTLTLYSFQRLTMRLGGDVGDVRLLTAAGIVLAAVAFAVVPRRIAAIAIPVAVGATLLAFSKPVVGATAGASVPGRGAAGATPTWIDDAVGSGADVPYLLTPSADVSSSSLVSLETEFWNRSVDTVYSLGASQLCPLPSIPVEVDDTTGRIVRVDRTPPEPIDARYVVATRGANIAGTVKANGGPETLLPLSLYEVKRPLRVGSTTIGIDADGWMHDSAAYTVYSALPGPGSVDVYLSRAGWTGQDVPGKATVTIGTLGRAADGTLAIGKQTGEAHTVLHSGQGTTLRLKAPRPPFRVEVHVDPTFSPSQFGASDTRQLGAQPAFTYVPG
ncbi:MAG: glycosyltransferase family 39 protein, partial [Gaiellaceae bacterium]